MSAFTAGAVVIASRSVRLPWWVWVAVGVDLVLDLPQTIDFWINIFGYGAK